MKGGKTQGTSETRPCLEKLQIFETSLCVTVVGKYGYLHQQRASLKNRLRYHSLSCAKLVGFRDRNSMHQKHTGTQVLGELTYGGELPLFRSPVVALS